MKFSKLFTAIAATAFMTVDLRSFNNWAKIF